MPLELAVLFGSGAQNRLRPDSDLDVGIIPSFDLSLRVARARARRPASPDQLRDDLLLQDALSMTLLVAVQEASDICFHIVADEAWGLPGSYAEGFELLAKHGVVDSETACSLSGMSA